MAEKIRGKLLVQGNFQPSPEPGEGGLLSAGADVGSGVVSQISIATQAQYDAISSPDPATLFIIVE